MLDTKVLITQSIHPDAVELLEKHISNVVLAPDPSPETLLSCMDDDVTGIIVRHNKITREMMEKARNLKVVSRHGIGTELIDVKAATEMGIPVINTPLAAADSVAEHTVMMILNLAKKLRYAENEFRGGGYAFKNTYKPDDIEGKTLGIVGFGNIGTRVAKKINGFGLNIVVYDKYREDDAYEKLGVKRLSSLEELLPVCDYITMHVPLTDETYRMIGKKQFEMMKPSCYYINNARGSVTDEKALIEALQNKTIQGAGLDVFDPEPPEKDNPLFGMDNVCVTPHSSSLTKEGSYKMAIQSAENLIKALEDGEITTLVNKDVKIRWK